jgi:hypothetical protein
MFILPWNDLAILEPSKSISMSELDWVVIRPLVHQPPGRLKWYWIRPDQRWDFSLWSCHRSLETIKTFWAGVCHHLGKHSPDFNRTCKYISIHKWLWPPKLIGIVSTRQWHELVGIAKTTCHFVLHEHLFNFRTSYIFNVYGLGLIGACPESQWWYISAASSLCCCSCTPTRTHDHRLAWH